jgi:hypothetical protein
MANEQNLIPITNEIQARKLGTIGGSRKTPAKKWAAQLRELKKKGLTDESYQKLVAIMEEPESSALDIFTFLQSIKAKCGTATQMTFLGQALIQWHKMHHGEKIKTENVHHVVNWNDFFKEVLVKDGKTVSNEDNKETV